MAGDGQVNMIAAAPGSLSPAERRLLLAMPLHTITFVHGKAGLRERLLIETARFPAADPIASWVT